MSDLKLKLTEQVPEDEVFVPGLDKGIEQFVLTLRRGGIETYESCEGGDGHAYTEPTIRFHGDASEGFRAYAWAKQHALPVSKLGRIWTDIDGELTGPYWEMVFWKKGTIARHNADAGKGE
jgi:hypothetical protein